MGNYYQIAHVKPVEICSLFKIFSTKGKNLFVEFVKSNAPTLVKNCPFKDKELQVNNSTSASGANWPGMHLIRETNLLLVLIFLILSDGHYRIFVTFNDNIDEKIFKVNFVAKIANKDDIQQF